MGFAFIEFEDRRDAEEAIAGEALKVLWKSYSCNGRAVRDVDCLNIVIPWKMYHRIKKALRKQEMLTPRF